MGTAYGRVIDYLFSGTITAAISPMFGQTLKQQLAAVDSNVVLLDNDYTPGDLFGGNSTVSLGRNNVDTASASSRRLFMSLGAFKVEEEFDVPIFIQTRGLGPTQKSVRDVGVGLLDAVIHFVSQDLTMAGALVDGRIGAISDYQFTQTETADATTGGALQTVEIAITLRCQNHYTP